MNPRTGRRTGPLAPLLALSLCCAFGSQARAFDGFIENLGQFPPQVHYLAFDGPWRIYLTSDALVIAYRAAPATSEDPVASARSPWPRGTSTAARTRPPAQIAYFRFVGAEAQPGSLTGRGRLPTTFNFFFGNDPDRWASSVPAFTRVVYDVGTSDSLEFSYGNGALNYRTPASSGLRLVYDAERSTLAATASGQPPAAASTTNGLLIHDAPAPGGDGGSIVLGPGANEQSPAPTAQRGVVPTSLVWSTLVGGGGFDFPTHVLMTESGDVIFVGYSSSLDFPVPEGIDPANNGSDDCVIGRLSADGSRLLWATYVGGVEADWARAACFLPDSTIAFTGGSYSGNFPVHSSAGPEPSGRARAWVPENVFVVRLSSDGRTLMTSALVGGGEDDEARDIVAAGGSSVVIGGITLSADFPTTAGAFNRQFVCCVMVFVAGYDLQSASLGWSTFLGGGAAGSLALDRAGNILVGGLAGVNFPVTPGSYDPVLDGHTNAFVSRLDPTGSSLLWSTFLGGDGDAITSLALDDSGEVYVVGATTVVGFPTTPGAIGPTYRGGASDCFLGRLSHDGQRLVWGTYLGGSRQDAGLNGADPGPCIAVRGNYLVVVGETISPDFPVTPDALDGQHHGAWDVFLNVFDKRHGGLSYGTYFGNTSSEYTTSMAVGAHGDVVIAGLTVSMTPGMDYPTTAGAFDRTFGGGSDIYVTKFSSPVVPVYLASMEASWCGPNAACVSWAVTDCGLARSFLVWAQGASGGLTLAADIPATGRCEFTWRDVAAGGRSGYALEMLDAQGGSTWFGPVALAVRAAVSDFAAISPNPSRDGVRIEFALAKAQRVRLGVFDVRGRLVATLLDGELPAAAHAISWDGRGRDGSRAPAGAYMVRLRGEGWQQCRRVAIVH